MFGPSGLSKIIREAIEAPGPDRTSVTLEIHPTKGRLPLGNASHLFTHWLDKGNAEGMNAWLSVLHENQKLILRTCGIKETVMDERKGMIIYNLFPLLAGKFSDWEKHLSRAADMGFTWVFVNPIQLPGSSGSIYSIKDYFSFNPLLIDQASGKPPEEQVREAVKNAEKLGLRMMVDLVINHCAADSDLIKSHPGWFVREANGRIAHPFADENGKKVVWKDLAQFDHRNTKDKEGLFRFFLDAVKFLAKLGFKGFRCDAAYQIPKSLWERLIREAKKSYPDLLFFAETLGTTPDLTRRTASAGFDYIFNSSKWWDFEGKWLMQQYNLTREIAPSISFPESHDTVRLCEEVNGNIDAIKQKYLFTALFSSGVMMPIGFEFGFRKRLHVVKTRPGRLGRDRHRPHLIYHRCEQDQVRAYDLPGRRACGDTCITRTAGFFSSGELQQAPETNACSFSIRTSITSSTSTRKILRNVFRQALRLSTSRRKTGWNISQGLFHMTCCRVRGSF